MTKFEPCVNCGKTMPRNSKGLCPDCVFKNSHGGRSKAEVYAERRSLRQPIEKKIKIYDVKPKTKKKTSAFAKDARLNRLKLRATNDEQLYFIVFCSTADRCEECGVDLPSEFKDDDGHIIYRTQYSHIMTKAAYPEFRWEPRNINRLCGRCHSKWEFGERTEMKIYEKNKITIQILLDENNGAKSKRG